MIENEISYEIRGSIYRVYRELGPGLLESAYEAAMIFDLESQGLKVVSQKPVPVVYQSIPLDVGFRIDLLVEDKVIVEIKSIEKLSEVHHKQVITYIKLANIKLGILVNFNSADIGTSIFRKVNGL